MKDYYKILGVEPDATPGEIAKAYKKRAHVLHPDKGGGTEAFKELGEAYRVLKDPESREKYDRGETPTPGGSPEQVARTRLAGLFQQAIATTPEGSDLIVGVRRGVQTMISQMTSKRAQEKAKLKKLKKVLKRVTYKGEGVNLFEGIIRQETDRTKAGVTHLTKELEIMAFIVGLLNDYEYEVEQSNGWISLSALSSGTSTSYTR